MAGKGEVRYRLTLDAKEFDSGIKAAKREFEGFVKDLGEGTGALGRVAQAAGPMGTALAAAAGVGVAGLTALAGAAALGAKAIIELAARGSEVQNLQRSFEALAAGANESGKKILESSRTASHGLVTDMEIMAAANKGFLLQLPITAKEMGVMTQTAIALGKAMKVGPAQALDNLITGLGRGSAQILDNLGITVAATDAYREYARAHKITVEAMTEGQKKLAVYNAAMAAAKDAVNSVGGIHLTTADHVTQMRVAIENAVDAMASEIASSPELIKLISDLAEGVKALATEFRELVPAIGNAFDYLIRRAKETMAFWRDMMAAFARGALSPFSAGGAFGLPGGGGGMAGGLAAGLIDRLFPGLGPYLRNVAGGAIAAGMSGARDIELPQQTMRPRPVDAAAQAAAIEAAKKAAAERLRIEREHEKLMHEIIMRNVEHFRRGEKEREDAAERASRAIAEAFIEETERRRQSIDEFQQHIARAYEEFIRATREAFLQQFQDFQMLGDAISGLGDALGSDFIGSIGQAISLFGQFGAAAANAANNTQRAAVVFQAAAAAFRSGSVLGGAAAGAQAGSMFGPWGAVIGGVAGGVLGLFGGNKRKKEEEKRRREEAEEIQRQLIEAEKEKRAAGLDRAVAAMPGLTGTLGNDGRVTGGLQITSEASAAAQAAIFSATFWGAVKEKGLVAGVDALKAPFDALKAKLAEGGFDVEGLLGGVGGLFDAVATEGPARSALEGADALRQALSGLADAQMLTQDSFAAFGQGAQDAFAQAVAGGLDTNQALLAMRPMLAEIVAQQQAYGFEVDSATQGLIDQSVAAHGAFPEAPMQKVVTYLEAIARALGALPEAASRGGTEMAETITDAATTTADDTLSTFGDLAGGIVESLAGASGAAEPVTSALEEMTAQAMEETSLIEEMVRELNELEVTIPVNYETGDLPDVPTGGGGGSGGDRQFAGGGVYMGPDGGSARLHYGETVFTPDQLAMLGAVMSPPTSAAGGRFRLVLDNGRELTGFIQDEIDTGRLRVPAR